MAGGVGQSIGKSDQIFRFSVQYISVQLTRSASTVFNRKKLTIFLNVETKLVEFLRVRYNVEICHTECIAEGSQYTRSYHMKQSTSGSSPWKTMEQNHGVCKFFVKQLFPIFCVQVGYTEDYFSCVVQKKAVRSLVDINEKIGRQKFPSQSVHELPISTRTVTDRVLSLPYSIKFFDSTKWEVACCSASPHGTGYDSLATVRIMKAKTR